MNPELRTSKGHPIKPEIVATDSTESYAHLRYIPYMLLNIKKTRIYVFMIFFTKQF